MGFATDLIVNGEHAGLHGRVTKYLPLTVQDLFELIRRAHSDASGLKVKPSTDSDLPESIWINWTGASDDEIKYTVTSLQPS